VTSDFFRAAPRVLGAKSCLGSLGTDLPRTLLDSLCPLDDRLGFLKQVIVGHGGLVVLLALMDEISYRQPAQPSKGCNGPQPMRTIRTAKKAPGRALRTTLINAIRTIRTAEKGVWPRIQINAAE
jgi:hypothetical protein